MDNLDKLVQELITLPNETEWIEFKHNNYDPYMIGKDISALANAATLREKTYAYMIWGIDDKTHEIIGTEESLQNMRKGSQELENWLRYQLSDNADFQFYDIEITNKKIGILIIYNATSFPVKFDGVDYIRIGSYTKKLKEFPMVESQLWDKLTNIKFEEQYAKTDLALNDALQLLDYVVYFDLCKIPVPSDMEGIAHFFIEDGIITRQDNGLYAITNLGAILFAKNMKSFPKISRKAIRVVQYNGNNRLLMNKEIMEQKGYASGFENSMKYIEALIPTEEVIIDARRDKRTAYPILAIRETIANSLIHQDFTISGTGPVVEVFDNRIEVTNPGIPLVDINRIIDNPPKSRNEKLASFMRRLGMCEELGTGWDKIVIACELLQLPAPKIELFESSTRVTLYSELPFASIAPEDRLRACYLHACIKQVQGEQLTNSSLRERFGVKDSSAGSISRLIKESVAV